MDITPEQAQEWRKREQARLDDGAYTRLPRDWVGSSWFGDPSKREVFEPVQAVYCRPPRFPDHFAHISVEKVAMVAFTENDKKGVADRQTRMSPGRYLNRFYSDWLTKDEIQYLATQMGAEYNDDAELHFAKTADEFEMVYTSGPSSCMSHAPCDYSSPVHPVRVYAGFDLELAYLKRDSRITARALVWPMRKIYGRVYGDEQRLVKKLNDLDYKTGSLHGAKITRLKHKKHYVIPYLDYLEGATDEGDHLVLSEDDYGCCGGDRQNGLSGEQQYACCCCDEYVSNVVNHNDDHYCSDCFNDRYWQCDRSGEYVSSDDESSTEVRTRAYHRNDGSASYAIGSWCQNSVGSYAFHCERDDVYYSCDFISTEMQNGEIWGPEAVARDAVLIDGEWYDRDDAPTELVEPYGPVYASTPPLPAHGYEIRSATNRNVRYFYGGFTTMVAT